MFENGESPPATVYQLRVAVRGISPLIWRRWKVPAPTTIAALHSILQTVFGWSGEHLHRFLIHGTIKTQPTGERRTANVTTNERQRSAGRARVE